MSAPPYGPAARGSRFTAATVDDGVERLYSTKDLAALWGCSLQHIYNLISHGQIAIVDISATGTKTKTRIRASEIIRYTDEQSRQAEPVAVRRRGRPRRASAS